MKRLVDNATSDLCLVIKREMYIDASLSVHLMNKHGKLPEKADKCDKYLN